MTSEQVDTRQMSQNVRSQKWPSLAIFASVDKRRHYEFTQIRLENE